MKKLFFRVVTLIVCAAFLGGCSFGSDSKFEAEFQVEDMLDALAEADYDEAKELLYPVMLYSSYTDAYLEQLVELLDGRTVEEISQMDMDVAYGLGTDGIYRTEVGILKVVFDNQTQLRIRYVYYSDNLGEGFTSFCVMLGL